MEHKVLLLAIYFFLSFQVSGQKLNLDSLKTEFQQLPQDTNRLKTILESITKLKNRVPQKEMKILIKFLWDESNQVNDDLWIGNSTIEVSSHFKKTGKLDSALFYLKQGQYYFEKTKNYRKISKNLGNLSLIYTELGEYDTALFLLRKSQKMDFINNYKFNEPDNHYFIGNVYDYQGKYDSAIIEFHRALDLSRGLKGEDFISKVLISIGITHLNTANYKIALDFFRQSLVIAQKINDKKGVAACYNNIGLVYDFTNQNDSALHYYFQSLEIDSVLGNKQGIANKYNNIGVIYENLGNYDSTEIFFLNSLKLKEEIGSPESLVSSYINLGDFYLGTNRLKKAKGYLEKALSLAQKIGAKKKEDTVYFLFHHFFRLSGDYKKALKYHTIYKSLDDSLFNIEKTKVIEELNTKYQTTENKRKLTQKALELEKEQAEKRRLSGVLIISILLLGVLFLVNQNIRKQKRLAERDKQILEEVNVGLKTKLEAPKELLNRSFTLTGKDKSILQLKDIIYIKSERNAVRIITHDKKIWEWQSLKTMKEILPQSVFLQTNRSYLVNIFEIKRKKAQTLTMSNGEVLKIGSTFKKKVHQFLESQQLEIT